MNQKPETLEIIKAWIQKAENDLKNAKHTILIDDCPFDTVCFHAHQCVEKYIKALLISKTISFPKSHDLTELLALLPDEIKECFSSDEFAELNPYAVEARYPGPWEPLERKDAIKAVELAEKIKSMIYHFIQKKIQ